MQIPGKNTSNLASYSSKRMEVFRIKRFWAIVGLFKSKHTHGVCRIPWGNFIASAHARPESILNSWILTVGPFYPWRFPKSNASELKTPANLSSFTYILKMRELWQTRSANCLKPWSWSSYLHLKPWSLEARIRALKPWSLEARIRALKPWSLEARIRA